MATLSTAYLTLADWATRIAPDGRVANIVNLLSQTNEILLDAMWVEANMATGHKTTVRTGIPSGTFRTLNSGVPRGKSTTAQIIDTCAMLETYSLVDKDLADLNGNSASFRLSEDMAFLEGLNQQMATTLFYGSTASNPERFNGLAARYPTVTSSATFQNAVNVLDAGGTGSVNTSIWLVCWGETLTHGIFPKGKRGGLQYNDVTTPAPVLDANGNPYQAYQTHYKWDCGLVVRDWRYNVRIANIDTVAIAGGSPPNLINLLTQAVYKPPTMPASAANVQAATEARGGVPLTFGRPVFYVNRTVAAWLSIQATSRANVLLRMEEFAGVPTMTFRGIPIRVCDAILNTEARVV